MRSPSQTIIDVVDIDGGMAALIEMILSLDHLLIENVAVAPEHQGHGLGRRMMAHAEAVAASAGFSEVRLYTNKLFAENIQLYVKLGYRIDREDPISDGVVVHMSKCF